MPPGFKATALCLRAGKTEGGGGADCPNSEDAYSVSPAFVPHLHAYRRVVQNLHVVSYPLSASRAGLLVLRVTSGARQQRVRPVLRTLVGAVHRQLRRVVQDVLCRDEGKGRSSAGEQICMQAVRLFAPGTLLQQ